MEPRKLEELDIAQFAAQDILQQIIENGGILLYDHYIQTRAVPFSVQQTIAVLSNALQAAYIRHDTGEPQIWQQDQQPIPCKIDTWARNAVPLKRKVKLRPVQQVSSNQPQAAQNKSVRSIRSGLSRTRVLKQGKTATTPSFQPIDQKVYIPTPIDVVVDQISQQEELLRQRKERQHQRRKNQQERLKKMKEEQDEKIKKMSREAEELKNKPFTYDKDGNIVLINPVKYDKLPPTALSAKPTIQNAPAQQTRPPRQQKKQQVVSKLKKPPQQEQEWVRNMTSVQPPIFDTIKLNAGVSISQGNQSKYAPVVSNPALTMTRAQYKQISQRGDTLLPSTPQQFDNKRESTHMSEQSLQQSIQPAKKEIFQGIPDYDIEGEILPEQDIDSPGMRKPVPSLMQQNKITHYGRELLETEGMSPVDKFNIEIMKNKNWGINPPVRSAAVPDRLPKRPSTKDLIQVYGDKIKKPKDQPFISTQELWEQQAGKLKKPRDRPYIERIEKKKHLPAPPFGQTMAHNAENVMVSQTGFSRKSSQQQ